MSADIRKILTMFDKAKVAPARISIASLKEVTKLTSKSPAAYGLTDEDDSWADAGGNSFCKCYKFPKELYKTWVEALSRPDCKSDLFTIREWTLLEENLPKCFQLFEAAELEGPKDLTDLLAIISNLKTGAQETSDDDDDDEDEDDE
mmetsp:Transcript_30353/g.55467  ORF Transcript_30353/g.55467 Transcript_30353/m.55467 type:complete len:147 (-) Transcript_30353:128-568(-)|eukprot:CAMPEP_0175050056 /NCGR_PEP_ID=MMETSP0052_2-20121109/7061_1 /TAXON_ID=51329 ORGANISM="Polytomella parva, Strain SAG 63-3" /NCGR_SAMPLE_ID=MMETSP0052_2 /ASSEMBLY_ACC=CAM_ASM_000194 /LENGTH=146 /DNA_ID=CAMNT_0016314245 /DNA_START=1313 /DNA_END=1753 /DNA_ORIENTATION=-